MMKVSRGWHLVMLLAWGVGSGCTSLREIPRTDYVAQAQNRPIRVVTREGKDLEFDAATIVADTLVGYVRRDVEGPIDEFDTRRLPLDEVATISARRVDWYRTGLIGGLSMAVVVAVALSRHAAATHNSPALPCDPKDPTCN